MIILLSLLFRSCVDEWELCKGVPLCNNKMDLKWCKGGSMWNVPDNWTPMRVYSYDTGWYDDILQIKCTFDNDTDPRGQWIHPDDKLEGRYYHCINRTDENPFLMQKNTTDDISWLEWVNSICDYWQRRCFGDKPNQCSCE